MAAATSVARRRVCLPAADQREGPFTFTGPDFDLRSDASRRLNPGVSGEHPQKSHANQVAPPERRSVQGLAELRNKLGHAHGRRRGGVRPQPRHARMAAAAAMAVATFLIETLEERSSDSGLEGR